MTKRMTMTALYAVLCSCLFVNQADAKDGVFEGVANGRNGQISVSVTLKNDRIEGVQVLKHSETPGISDAALTQVPEAIVRHQSIQVDAVSGATRSSDGIKEAVKDALTKAGLKLDAFLMVPTKVDKTAQAEVLHADIIVVGTGAAGMTAAVKAESLGAKVILIEKQPVIGGVTQLNAGTLIATGSRYQREVMKELNDSPELAYQDIMRIGKNKNDPVLVKAVTQNVGGVVDWLIDDLKIPYGPAATQYPDHSANRQLGVQGRSVNFLRLMREIFENQGGRLMLNTKAESLIRNKDGKVIGVKAKGLNGQEYDLEGKAVILATGGFGAVKSMLPAEMNNFVFYGLPFETGDGYHMAKKVGADEINMSLVKKYPQGVETEPGHGLAATASSTDTIKKSGAIYVNKDGRRYVNERAGLGVLTDETIKQPEHMAYIVMDEPAWQIYVKKSLEDKLVPDEQTLNAWTKIKNNGKPVMVVSPSLEEAAKQMGINASNLLATVKDWNEMVASGKDTAFDRPLSGELKQGPWHIVEQKVRYQTTLGGLKANQNLQILNVKGKPIAGLFGAGCVVGGANGADSMTAMMNSWAIVSGAIAAEQAVKSIHLK